MVRDIIMGLKYSKLQLLNYNLLIRPYDEVTFLVQLVLPMRRNLGGLVSKMSCPECLVPNRGVLYVTLCLVSISTAISLCRLIWSRGQH